MFRRRPKLSPLVPPSSSSIPVPDMKTFQRHPEDIRDFNRAAQEQAGTAEVREESQLLIAALVDRLANHPDEGVREYLQRALSACARLGWGYAKVEEKSELAPPGWTDERIRTAVIMAQRGFPDELDDGATFAMFLALQAGHYVGRSGNATISAVVDNLPNT